MREVLAFIDDFDSDETNSCSSNNDIDINPLKFKRQQPSNKSSSQWSRKSEWKRRRKAESSRRTHQRRRAELLRLREEVKTLESRLDELRGMWHHGCLLSSLPTKTTSDDNRATAMWVKQAVVQRHLQIQAQIRNRKLKAAVDTQYQMASTLSQMQKATIQSVEADLVKDNSTNHCDQG